MDAIRSLGHRLDNQGIAGQFTAVTRYFSSPQSLDWPWDPYSLLSSGYERFFAMCKAYRARNGQLIPSSTEVKEFMGAITVTCCPCLHGVMLQKTECATFLFFHFMHAICKSHTNYYWLISVKPVVCHSFFFF